MKFGSESFVRALRSILRQRTKIPDNRPSTVYSVYGISSESVLDIFQRKPKSEGKTLCILTGRQSDLQAHLIRRRRGKQAAKPTTLCKSGWDEFIRQE